MPFLTAISGLNASSAQLKVIGNNIANTGTTGFKLSRAQFADVVPGSSLGSSALAIGSGTRLSAVSQQFNQGNINFTSNSLDLAISGQGFYRMNNNGAINYSRNGAFGLDANGYIVNNTGSRLTGYLADTSGNVTGTLGDLQLSSADNPPKATTQSTAGLNLDAGEAAKTAADPPLVMDLANPLTDANGNPYVPPRYPGPNPDSYNQATSYTVYDTLGVAHTATMYFRKTADNAWTAELSIDNQDFTVPAEGTALTFDNAGILTGPAGPPLGILTYTQPVGSGAADLAFTIDFASTTQYGGPFSVSSLTQDGYTTGRLAGVQIDPDGTIFGNYTNGQSQALGQVVLANFKNPQGLSQLGDTTWAETGDSGTALLGTPGSSSLGLIQSGALEDSNVDLTAQLVALITAQRNFQANAQVISTADQVTQTIINLR